MANLTLIQRLQAAAARSIDEGLRQDGTLEKLLGVDAEAEREPPEAAADENEETSNDEAGESPER